ncbi:MAG: PDZ domain-containing protein, partial [Desulfobacterales bacterium]|nr:PDZ domain-containing protein [Desulfobacterales bacterium]
SPSITRAAPPASSPSASSPSASSPSGVLSVSKTELDKQAGNLSQILRDMTIRPYIPDGKPEGVTLLNMKENSVFTQMGFQNGDIITGVNGERIESVSEALNFYKRLKSSSRVAVNVIRGGREETIDYVIE